jgi:glycosyltransferase involved in cell wall biosynthesis
MTLGSWPKAASTSEGTNVTDMVLPADAENDAVLAAPDEVEAVLDGNSAHPSTIGCVIPADYQEESIAQVIESLLGQTRVPDVVHVVVSNASDATMKIASQYAGPHEITTDLGEHFTEVFVHDIGKNPDRKVGALNYGYSLVEGNDYLLSVAGDAVADARAVEYLEAEATSDTRIGGISAICLIDGRPIKGLVPRFLITGQPSQFAAFSMNNLLRGPDVAVLGGHFSIFSTQALRDVMAQNHQSSPWVKDGEVENSLLSLQIRSAGYLTRISPFARADIGGMATRRDGQPIARVAHAFSMFIKLIRRRRGYKV